MRIQFPLFFYYLQSNSSKRFSKRPNGKLNVARLIKNLPYWEDMHATREYRPKTLILADWSARNWTREERMRVEALLKFLLEHGFRIYIWQKDTVIPLEQNNLEILGIRFILSQITAAYPEKITQIACDSLKIANDQVLLLDDDMIKRLALYNKGVCTIYELDEKRISYADYLYLESWESIIVNNIKGRAKSGSFLKDYWTSSRNDTHPIMRHFNTEEAYRELALDSNTPGYDEFYGWSPSQYAMSLIQLTTLRLYFIDFATPGGQKIISYLGSCQRLEKISLENCSNLDVVANVLQRLSTLREITVYSNEFDEEPRLFVNTLIAMGSQIRSLLLENMNIPWEKLQSLMDSLSNIEELSIEYNEQIGQPIQLAPANLRSLQEIKWVRIKVAASFLQTLLSQAPNLQSIFLGETFDLLSDLTILPDSCPKLRSLDIDSCISAKNLAIILKATPNIQELSTDFVAIKGNVHLEPNSLKALEVVSIKGTPGSLEFLTALLSAAPNLSKINLRGFHQLSEVIQLNHAAWKKIKSFKISNSIAFENNFQAFLEIASNLEVLKIKNCNLSNINLSANALPYLHSLVLHDLPLLEENLLSFLRAAPHLDALMLFDCDIPEKFELQPNSLLNLKNFELTVRPPKICFISRNQLKSLFQAAPNLKGLSLPRSYILPSDETDLELPTLSQLDFLNLSGSKLLYSDLKTFLRASPNLQTLHFTLSEKETIDEELNSLLERVPTVVKLKKETREDQAVASPQEEEQCTVLDADTISKPEKYTATRIFYPTATDTLIPNISDYRLRTFNTITVKRNPCSISNAFSLRNDSALQLCHRNIVRMDRDVFAIGSAKKREGFDYMYGKQTLHLQGQWKALASLDPRETMTHFHVHPQNTNIEIQYSQRDNLYYARQVREDESEDTGSSVTIDFLLEVPKNRSDCTSLRKEISYFQSFSEGTLEIDKQEPNGNDYLRYITLQRKGACRHRAFAFKAQLDHRRLVSRMVFNQIHAFVEVWIENEWVQCNLGGYRVNVELNESYHPTQLAGRERQQKPTTSLSPLDSELGQYYLKSLQTWEKNHSLKGVTVEEYCALCVHPFTETKKRLIEFNSTTHLLNMKAALFNYCVKFKRPFFYVDTPDDLNCRTSYIFLNNNNQGELRKGPGGPLYQFLENHRDVGQAPVLIVNYDHFNAEDLIRFNGLLDKIRHADGIPLPGGTLVIGLINLDNPECYQGDDFYSRFDRNELCPISEQLESSPREIPPTLEKKKGIIINLYGRPDWKEQLLGYWELDGNILKFKEGLYQNSIRKAQASGDSIVIQNGPWSDEEFIHFWQQLFQGGFFHEGTLLKIPPAIQVFRYEGYDWDKLSSYAVDSGELTAQAKILNPENFANFLSHYEFKEESIRNIPGWIEEARHQEKAYISVYLTRNLNEDVWARLLEECQKHQIFLHVYCSPGVTLPELIENKLTVRPPLPYLPWTIVSTLPDTAIIVSADPSITAAQCARKLDNWVIIDVSECKPEDVLIRVDGKFNESTLSFEFTQKKCALLLALQNGNNVILKGHFSNELADALMPLLFQRQYNTASESNKLILISDADSPFTGLPGCYAHMVTEEEWFEHNAARMLSEFSSSSATRQQNLHPILQSKLDEVLSKLAVSPCVFISGHTGGGKTTFVEDILCAKESTNKLYMGESSILNWATDLEDPHQLKILFIDEANLSNSLFTRFNDLFNIPPTILIEGKVYPLTEKHKVVFAGNPHSYGDERKIIPLLNTIPSVWFDPLPNEVIDQYILQPLFAGKIDKFSAHLISERLLAMYSFICSLSEEEILISPRELGMLCLLIVSYCHKNKITNGNAVAGQLSWEFMKQLVPPHLHSTFDQKYKPEVIAPPRISHHITMDFLITPSRQPLIQQLEDWLTLREWRMECSGSANENQLYGGLGGLILEGEPGIGKSEMVFQTLIANGYTEAHGFTNPTVGNKHFYHMPVSMSFSEKETLLYKAFHEGAVVVVDEINSAPMMERLLNSLLMGKTPQGERPNTPGFMLIGTQNPITMAGRRAASPALARRMLTIQVPSYTKEEMLAILQDKNIPASHANIMVEAFLVQSNKARENNLRPIPNFRNLLHLVDKYNHTRPAKLDSDNEAQEPPAKKQKIPPSYAFFIQDNSDIGGSFCDDRVPRM
ncbi:AAA domain (dynein-related subfamily) (plasmid) [Legionella adelaidensis]|uniref:AAA domain (Dynein-related subfamily) n=1 Tax=Legionella adelaidensis TaxID=45056 RepID=A0A0W0R5D1_9GAMM|nr:AAA family ATPase [Legionella adelaidensis]KTC66272.1 AAA domain (dynein-related subfamily) [Legionella adelaidensis]VEH84868.1 AAA domain (dynein-related subfamily) [Legionella adelaidensis]